MWHETIRTYGRLIKFSHTIFALPFALAAVLLAHRVKPLTLPTFLWIIVAMTSARSASMGFNRLVDIRFDRMNPRTADRPSVTGEIRPQSIAVFIVVSSCIFIGSAAMLGRLCLILAVPCLTVLFFYSYTKRFTALSHLFLGFSIGLAPVGAWIAVTGDFDWRILLLALALMTYIAGFDILYACQDRDFDLKIGLHSLPAKKGIPKALFYSALLHIITLMCLFLTTQAFALGKIYVMGVVAIGALLVTEHWIVRPGRLDRIDLAFFHVNSMVSILFFLSIFADLHF